MTLASPAPSKIIDSQLFDSLTVLERLPHFPRESRTYVRVDLSHRQYWHNLFDICPKVLELSPPDGLDIFRPFMAWANEQNLSFDWSYYLWVYEWLRQSRFCDRLSEDLLIEVMGASAARWAVQDRGPHVGLVVGSAGCATLVVAWKNRKVDLGRTVEVFETEEPLPEPERQFGIFTLPRFELDAFPGWRPIPR